MSNGRMGGSRRVTRSRWAPLVALLGLLEAQACGFSPVGPVVGLELSEQSGEPIDGVPCVPRLVLRGAEVGELEDLWLLEGKVTSATEDKLLRGEVSESIEERRVPLAVWTEADAVHLAPTIVLEPATTYTLFVMGRGSPGVIHTTSDACELWHRWGNSEPTLGASTVYCTVAPPWLLTEIQPIDLDDRAGEAESTWVTLEPLGVPARLSNGLLRPTDGCIELGYDSEMTSEFDGKFLLPPQSFDDRWFEPTPLWATGLGGAGSEVLSERNGEEGDAWRGVHVVSAGEILEVELAPGLHVLELARADTRGERTRLVRFVEARAIERLGPVEPGAYVLESLSISASGQRAQRSSTLDVEAGTAEPILTEVLANPNGPEPDAEWVEIYNPSTVPRSLEGYRLHDSAGMTELPPVLLPAGGFGLVVTTEYKANPGVDVVPDARAVPIVVEAIGKLGLANSGEEIRLVNAVGEVVSRIPAIAGKEGISVVRRHPLAPDLPTSFGAHGPPGASPGSAVFPDDVVQ